MAVLLRARFPLSLLLLTLTHASVSQLAPALEVSCPPAHLSLHPSSEAEITMDLDWPRGIMISWAP